MLWADFLKCHPCFVDRAPFFCFFLFEGGVNNGWISRRARPVVRLWSALVGSVVEPPFFQKWPAIEMIQIVWCFFFDFKGRVEKWVDFLADPTRI